MSQDLNLKDLGLLCVEYKIIYHGLTGVLSTWLKLREVFAHSYGQRGVKVVKTHNRQKS